MKLLLDENLSRRLVSRDAIFESLEIDQNTAVQIQNEEPSAFFAISIIALASCVLIGGKGAR